MDLHDVSSAQRAAQADKVATFPTLLLLWPLMHPFTADVQPLFLNGTAVAVLAALL
jgi:hypothetical protein